MHVGVQVSKRLAKQLTKDNDQAAINKAIILKAELDTGKDIKNPSKYILVSLQNFFDTFKHEEKPSVSCDPSTLWKRFIVDMCNATSPEEERETISHMAFESFDPSTTPKKTLIIRVPSKEIAIRMTSEYEKLASRLLKKHFGDGVTAKFRIPKERRNQDAAE